MNAMNHSRTAAPTLAGRLAALCGAFALAGCVTYAEPVPVYEPFPCSNCGVVDDTVIYREYHYYDPWAYGPYYGPAYRDPYYDRYYYYDRQPRQVIVAPHHPRPASPPPAAPAQPATPPPPPRYKPRDPGAVPQAESPRRPADMQAERRKPSSKAPDGPRRVRGDRRRDD
jgi:hypothetical protein